MENKEKLIRQIYKDSNILHISFEHLNQGNFDTGFSLTKKDGKDCHHVTRDITVSVQKFHHGTLINMLYSNGRPMWVQLIDDVVPYYSDYIEWRYILNGHFEVEFEGEITSFEENEICFINSSACHRESVENSECVIINISINRAFFNERFISSISLTPLQKFLRSNILQRGYIEKYLKFTPLPSDTAEIQRYVFMILNEVRFQKPGYQDISRGYIIRLMDTLAMGYRFNFSKDDSNKYYDSLFESISKFMKEHLNTVTMNSLIETFHFQANYFNNLIKRYTGLTYSNYLISLRIERAKELLESTDLSVEEIIWIVGYHNKGFFYKRFTEATGISPAHYRNTVIHTAAKDTSDS